jgi:hypothetical protein
MGNIENKQLDSQDEKYLMSYDEVVTKMTQKGFKLLSDVGANSFITKRFEYWIKDDECTEPTFALIEILRNNEAIVYLETDIEQVN